MGVVLKGNEGRLKEVWRRLDVKLNQSIMGKVGTSSPVSPAGHYTHAYGNKIA